MIISTRLGGLVVAAAAAAILTSTTAFASSPASARKDRPVITSITPAKGDPSGQVLVLVRGDNFAAVQSVTVAGQSAEFQASDDETSQLLVRVPALHAGTYQVVVTTPDGSSAKTQQSEYHVKNSPWTVVARHPFNGHTGGFAASDCSRTDCYAVGSEAVDRSKHLYRPVVFTQHKNGSWHQVQLTAPKGKYRNSFVTVGCGNQGTCAAAAGVAHQSPSRPARTTFAVGSGNNWTASSAALPSDEDVFLDWHDITCRAQRCMALGSYEADDGSTRRLVVETFAHGTWTIRKVPGSATIDPKLAKFFGETGAIACPTTSTCIGVTRLANDQPVAVTVDLTSSGPAEVVPLPLGLTGTDNAAAMTDVACPTTTRCIAIGDAYNLSWDDADEEYDESGFHSFAEVYSHGTWSEQELPTPDGFDAGSGVAVWAHAIDCATTGTCFAAGQVTIPANGGWPPGYRPNATVTRFTSSGATTVYPAMPDRYGGDSRLDDVDCASGSTCTAFGENREDLGDKLLDFRFSVHLGTSQRPLYWHSAPLGSTLIDEQSDACRTPTRCMVTADNRIFEK
jgi:hypothetical protein